MSTSIYQSRTLLVTLCAQKCDRCGRRGECVELCTDLEAPVLTIRPANVAYLCTRLCWRWLVIGVAKRKPFKPWGVER